MRVFSALACLNFERFKCLGCKEIFDIKLLGRQTLLMVVACECFQCFDVLL